MDSIIVALVLAEIFFGAIAWLVIRARRQERQAVPVNRKRTWIKGRKASPVRASLRCTCLPRQEAVRVESDRTKLR